MIIQFQEQSRKLHKNDTLNSCIVKTVMKTKSRIIKSLVLYHYKDEERSNKLHIKHKFYSS